MNEENIYIILKDFGYWGMGNQIFQYLFLLKISEITNRKIAFIENDNLEKVNIQNYFKNIEINTIILDHEKNYNKNDNLNNNKNDNLNNNKNDNLNNNIVTIKEVNENNKDIIDRIINNDTKIIILEGFFQSYKYYKNISSYLHKKLSFIKSYNETAINIIEKCIIDQQNVLKLQNSSNIKLVSIHIRRGDYINYLDYHTLLPLTYYIESIDMLSNKHKNIFFIVCSDDIEWCERVFDQIKDKSYFSKNDPIVDMLLMSKCDINIISNSSFSLLSYYFNKNKNKQIISPGIWFGNKHKKYNINDIVDSTNSL